MSTISSDTKPVAELPQRALVDALRNIRFLLRRDDRARLIYARPELSALKQQDLPDHLRISVKKRIGPRVPIRGSRDSPFPRMVLARWPKDRLAENALPSLACVIHGAGDLRVGDYVLHCQSGDFIFYEPGLATADGSYSHFEDDAAGRQCSLLWVFPGRINGEGLECYICDSHGNTHSAGVRLWCRNHLLAELFRGIQEQGPKAQRQESTFHLLCAMLHLLQCEIHEGHASPAPYFSPFEKFPEAVHDPIQQARAYVTKHLNGDLTIAKVSRYVCLSPSVFTRKFKHQTGQTFNEYCTSLRLKQAALLLTQTDTKIVEVSRMVGLTDCQFRQLARRHWRCSPREYRRAHN